MRTSDVIDYIGCTALVAVVVVLGCYIDRAKHPAVAPPDTAGFWQQANTAKQIECRDLVLAEVLRMKLPAEAYTDPALATAMQQGRELCLLKNKVMI